MSNVCSICLVESKIVKDDEIISYKGKGITVSGLSFYECPECGEQFADSTLDKENSILIREAKKNADGLLSSARIQKIREFLGITQGEAAKIFGGGANAFSKYERGEVSQSEAMDKLMRAATSVDGLFEWLCKEAGVRPSRSSVTKPEHTVHYVQGDFLEVIDLVSVVGHIESFPTSNLVNPLVEEELYKAQNTPRKYKSINFCADISEETLDVRH